VTGEKQREKGRDPGRDESRIKKYLRGIGKWEKWDKKIAMNILPSHKWKEVTCRLLS